MEANQVDFQIAQPQSKVEREAYAVRVLGTVPPDSADALKEELSNLGLRYGLTFKVYPVVVAEHPMERLTQTGQGCCGGEDASIDEINASL